MALLLALAVLGAGSAAASARDDRAQARPVVLAAASLTEVLPRIAPDAAYSFGSSNSLAEQIRRGAPVDVYLSASPIYTQTLFREELTRKPVAFATNSLVVIVPRSNPAKIKTVFDLAKRPKLRLVVAGPKVPIGLYTREVLKRLGLLRVLKKNRQPRAGRQGHRRQGRTRSGGRGVRLPDRRCAGRSARAGDLDPGAGAADGRLRAGDRGETDRPGGGAGLRHRRARAGRAA